MDTIDGSRVLMLHGTVGPCPDCGDERVLLPSDGLDGFCCTACDAAVFAVELDAWAGVMGAGAGELQRLAG